MRQAVADEKMKKKVQIGTLDGKAKEGTSKNKKLSYAAVSRGSSKQNAKVQAEKQELSQGQGGSRQCSNAETTRISRGQNGQEGKKTVINQQKNSKNVLESDDMKAVLQSLCAEYPDVDYWVKICAENKMEIKRQSTRIKWLEEELKKKRKPLDELVESLVTLEFVSSPQMLRNSVDNILDYEEEDILPDQFTGGEEALISVKGALSSLIHGTFPEEKDKLRFFRTDFDKVQIETIKEICKKLKISVDFYG